MNLLTSWKKVELGWLFLATSVIVGLSLYWGDTTLGILSAATGVICVVLTAKGSLWCFAWGLVNCLLYSYIGYINNFYGEFMLNLFYYVPMQFVGVYMWRKNMNSETNIVSARRMSLRNKIILSIISICGIILWGFWLNELGGKLPYIDSTTNVLSIIAMIISIMRYAEQWLLWIFIDILSIGMWVFAVMDGSDNLATLLMWSVYLINAIWGYIKWSKDANKKGEI